jgi:hypothetical protein
LEAVVSNQRDLSVFYLLGGIGFIALGIFFFVASPQHDSSALLGAGGMVLAGVLVLSAYLGLRRHKRR